MSRLDKSEVRCRSANGDSLSLWTCLDLLVARPGWLSASESIGCKHELAAGWLEESAVRRSLDDVEWLCLLVPDKLSRRPLLAPANECQVSST